MIEQYKESNISTKKEKTIDKISKSLNQIYSYIVKKIKSESFIKDSLLITKGKFLEYEEEDKSVAKIMLFDERNSIVTAFIILPVIKYTQGQTVYLGYYNDFKNLMVLGMAEKKRGENYETN